MRGSDLKMTHDSQVILIALKMLASSHALLNTDSKTEFIF